MPDSLDIDWRSLDSADLKLSGLQILVTGAASGIGRAVTIELASKGACVIMLDQIQPQANRTAT